MKKDIEIKRTVQALNIALAERDCEKAFECLGVLKYLKCDDVAYYTALIYCADQQYERAIKTVEKAGLQTKKRGMEILWECYAYLGDIVKFHRIINELSKMPYDFWKSIFLTQVIYDVRSPEMSDKEIRELNSSSEMTVLKQKFENEEYKQKVLEKTAEAIVETVELMEEYARFSDDKAFMDGYEPRRFQLENIIGCISPVLDSLLNEELDGFTSPKQFELYRTQPGDVKKYAARIVVKTLMVNRPEKYVARSHEKAFKLLYRLDDEGVWDFILTIINDSIHAVIENNMIKDMAYLSIAVGAYEEESFRGNINTDIKKYVEHHISNTKEIEQSIQKKRLINSLTDTGRIALRAADWQYDESTKSDYGWKDAGLISLAYYRIIEQELNARFVRPLVQLPEFDRFIQPYIIGELSFHPKKDWHISALKPVYNKNKDGVELGILEELFRCIRRYIKYQNGREAEKKVAIIAESLLTEAGKAALLSEEMKKLCSKETRSKYRNPPAHTRYLSYAVAKECRTFVYEMLPKIATWFK